MFLLHRPINLKHTLSCLFLRLNKLWLTFQIKPFRSWAYPSQTFFCFHNFLTRHRNNRHFQPKFGLFCQNGFICLETDHCDDIGDASFHVLRFLPIFDVLEFLGERVGYQMFILGFNTF